MQGITVERVFSWSYHIRVQVQMPEPITGSKPMSRWRRIIFS